MKNHLRRLFERGAIPQRTVLLMGILVAVTAAVWMVFWGVGTFAMPVGTREIFFQAMLEGGTVMLTVMIGVATVILMYEQTRASARQWKIAVWDKRYTIYEETMKFLAGVARSARTTREELTGFLRGTRARSFLFGEDIERHLEAVYETGNRMLLLQAKLEHGRVDEVKLELELQDLVEWCIKAEEISREMFQEYLSVREK